MFCREKAAVSRRRKEGFLVCLVGRPEDREGISRLWREVFGDPEEYVALFFNRCWRPEDTLLWREGNQIAAMLFLLPCCLSFPGEREAPGYYVYAVATGKPYRGRGLSSLLLEEAARLSRERGRRFLTLVPAEKSLFDFYGRRGYEIQGWVRRLAYAPAGILPQGGFSLCGSGVLERVRNSFFAPGLLRWDARMMAYLEEENGFLGGEFLSFPLPGGGTGAAACRVEGEVLSVRELVCPQALVLPALEGLCRRYGASRCQARLAPGLPFGKLTPLAMTRWLGEDPGGKPFYLSHTLD